MQRGLRGEKGIYVWRIKDENFDNVLNFDDGGDGWWYLLLASLRSPLEIE